VPDIIERDDGWFEVAVGDDAMGPFVTRDHARDVWLNKTSHGGSDLILAT
jgi:hypothetical protein